MQYLIYVACLLAGLALGVLAGWLFGSAGGLAAEHETAALRAQLADRDRAQEEKQKEVELAQQRLSDSFKALAADALNANNRSFLDLAKAVLETHAEGGQRRTGPAQSRRRDAGPADPRIARQSGPPHRRDGKGARRGLRRADAAGAVARRVAGPVADRNRATGARLRAPQTRGRWGEITLRRVVEMAGMAEHCDFDEQVSVDTEGLRQRPDLIVRLPGGRVIVVDAKVSLKSYLDALEAPDEAARAACLQDHARQVKDHITRLGSKNYCEQFEKTPDFVVAFLPGDPFLGAAFEKDPGLLEYGVERKVLIATPATLIALLKAVAYGWRQESVEENAQKICDLGKELYDRIVILAGHFGGVGGLDRAVRVYNDAVGTLEARVLVTTRKFRDLQAAGSREMPEPVVVDRSVRAIQAPELTSAAGGEYARGTRPMTVF